MNKTYFFALGLLSFNALADHYCAGIRGNGELVPAQWMAMARIVENKGMP